MARPSKYTDDLVAKLCELIAEGLSIAKACDLCGIGVTTYQRWHDEYEQFRIAVKRARAECERWHLNQIKAGSRNGAWQASAWYLERTNPKTYGRVATLPAPQTENAVQTKLDLLLEGFKRETHAPDYIDTTEADNE